MSNTHCVRSWLVASLLAERFAAFAAAPVHEELVVPAVPLARASAETVQRGCSVPSCRWTRSRVYAACYHSYQNAVLGGCPRWLTQHSQSPFLHVLRIALLTLDLVSCALASEWFQLKRKTKRDNQTITIRFSSTWKWENYQTQNMCTFSNPTKHVWLGHHIASNKQNKILLSIDFDIIYNNHGSHSNSHDELSVSCLRIRRVLPFGDGRSRSADSIPDVGDLSGEEGSLACSSILWNTLAAGTGGSFATLEGSSFFTSSSSSSGGGGGGGDAGLAYLSASGRSWVSGTWTSSSRDDGSVGTSCCSCSCSICWRRSRLMLNACLATRRVRRSPVRRTMPAALEVAQHREDERQVKASCSTQRGRETGEGQMRRK